MKTNRLRPQHKLKTLQKGTLLVACFSIAFMMSYLFIGLNQADLKNSNAATKLDMLATDPINNGEIICGFEWDQNLPMQSDIGPSAEKINLSASFIPGGRDNTNGLSAGNNGRNINMFITAEKIFNINGIDISIDFRSFEESGSFFTRGSYFNFGMKGNRIVIKYNVKGDDGKIRSVDEITRYEVPQDTIYRNYRFLYNPQEAKGEIFVENVAVWSNQSEFGGNLWWNETDPIIIGDEMNGGAKGKAIMDNLMIRSTMRGRTLPLQLLSFTAEAQGKNIMLNWFTGREEGTDYFKIERSLDTYTFEEVGMVKAAGKSNELKAYALLDTKPSSGVSYYRLSMPNTDVKSVWVPVIALKMPISALQTISEPFPGISDAPNK